MNPFGRFNPANYSATNPFNLDTGLGYEYIRIINNSPYLLQLSFGNMGGEDFPEMFLEDKLITKEYNGKLSIIPFANFSAQVISEALSSLVSINTYLPGEIKQPQAQPLTTLAAVGGGALSQATSVVQTGQPVPTPVVSATPNSNFNSAPHVKEAIINNDGTFTLGDAGTSAGGLVITSTSAGFIGAAQFVAQGGASVPSVSFLGRSPIQLQTGNQETGYCGASFEVGSSVASAVGPVTNFKTIMTNVPTSITLNTPIENSGASSPAAADINIYGFWLTWTATTVNSLSRYTNTYTTVGN